MKILVTGAKGFIGQNLIERLKENKELTIFPYDLDSTSEELEQYTKECDFVFHLAGVNRPKDEKEFLEGNFGFTSVLLNHLKKYKNKAPVMISSSIQAVRDNPYGISKKAGEELMLEYEKETGAKVYIFRFENVFGKWARPNYNSAVATFSYNIANDLPITVNDPDVDMQLIYIDDVVDSLLSLLDKNNLNLPTYLQVTPVYKVKLGYIAELLYSFKESRQNLTVPKLDDGFEKKLYSNYLSYLPKDKFIYDLKMNIDNRGSFTEFIRTIDRGQFSVNVAKPGITKGNHWHHTKNEKFLVVSGKAVIRFRKVNTDEVIEYHVSGDKLQVLDIPPGYTHNIENVGDTDLVTLMWANEPFDKNNPDTIYEEVLTINKSS
jgi:UDP-2-acetamido-2,6-beta-L-arabino-hexul-4-ose reductase